MLLQMSARRPLLVYSWFPYVLLLLVLFGSVLLGLSLYFQYRQRILSFNVIPLEIQTVTDRAPEPQTLRIPSQSLNLGIAQAQIKKGVWEIAESQASHLQLSARPGEKGNVVIYGHNKPEILGKLHQLRIGETVVLINDQGQEFVYQIENKKVVSPEFIEAVMSTNYEKLTIYTCTGFLDSQRLILEGRLQKEINEANDPA